MEIKMGENNPNDWKVYYGSNFEGHEPYARPGKEIAVNQEFFWEGECFQILSLYICSKGLVMDYCKKIDPIKMNTFLENWIEKYQEMERLSEVELELMEAENPAELRILIECIADGRQLRNRGTSSLVWYRYESKLTNQSSDPQAGKFLKHYGLNQDLGWLLMRSSFPWLNVKKQKLKQLTFHFSERPVTIAGPDFVLNRKFPQKVYFTHPVTNTKHTLSVESYTFEQIPESSILQLRKKFRYPRYYEVLHYTLEPELEEGSYFVQSTEKSGDQPIPIKSNSESQRAANISIIGGADGPTSIFISSKLTQNEKTVHTAFSPLFFEPTKVKEWMIFFRVRRKKQFSLTLNL